MKLRLVVFVILRHCGVVDTDTVEILRHRHDEVTDVTTLFAETDQCIDLGLGDEGGVGDTTAKLLEQHVVAHQMLEGFDAETLRAQQALVEFLVELTVVLHRRNRADFAGDSRIAGAQPGMLGVAQQYFTIDDAFQHIALQAGTLLLKGLLIFGNRDLFAVDLRDVDRHLGIDVLVHAPHGEGNDEEDDDSPRKPTLRTVTNELKHDREALPASLTIMAANAASAPGPDCTHSDP